jgi:hypothetical protein
MVTSLVVTPARAQSRFIDGQRGEEHTVQLDDLLLSADFVVEGRLVADARDSSALQVEVTRVLLGAIPSHHLAIQTLSGGYLQVLGSKAGQRVLAWGVWGDGDLGDCFGNALAIQSNGALKPGMRYLQLSGHSLLESATFDSLESRLSSNADEHIRAWLEGGVGIGVATIVSKESSTHAIHLALARVIAGESGSCPAILLYDQRQDCFVGGSPGDSILVPLFATSKPEIATRVCLRRVFTPAGRLMERSPFGVHVSHLNEIIELEDGRLRIRQYHGVLD